MLGQLIKHDLELSSCRRFVLNIVSGQAIQELSQVFDCGGLAILIELDGPHLVQLLDLLQDLFFALARLGNRVVDQDRFESLCTIFLVLGHLIFNNLRLFCFREALVHGHVRYRLHRLADWVNSIDKDEA